MTRDGVLTGVVRVHLHIVLHIHLIGTDIITIHSSVSPSLHFPPLCLSLSLSLCVCVCVCVCV